MLITESEKARVLRQVILDIANDAINQRDEDYIVSYFKEEDYRRQFDVIIAASVEPPSKSVPFGLSKQILGFREKLHGRPGHLDRFAAEIGR